MIPLNSMISLNAAWALALINLVSMALSFPRLLAAIIASEEMWLCEKEHRRRHIRYVLYLSIFLVSTLSFMGWMVFIDCAYPPARIF